MDEVILNGIEFKVGQTWYFKMNDNRISALMTGKIVDLTANTVSIQYTIQGGCIQHTDRYEMESVKFVEEVK